MCRLWTSSRRQTSKLKKDWLSAGGQNKGGFYREGRSGKREEQRSCPICKRTGRIWWTQSLKVSRNRARTKSQKSHGGSSRWTTATRWWSVTWRRTRRRSRCPGPTSAERSGCVHQGSGRWIDASNSWSCHFHQGGIQQMGATACG